MYSLFIFLHDMVSTVLWYFPSPPDVVKKGVKVMGAKIIAAEKFTEEDTRYSLLTCCHMDLRLYCFSHLIIVISNNATSSSSPRKRVSCLFPFSLSVYPLNNPLGCLNSLIDFPLSVFSHHSHSPASLPDHHEKCLI